MRLTTTTTTTTTTTNTNTTTTDNNNIDKDNDDNDNNIADFFCTGSELAMRDKPRLQKPGSRQQGPSQAIFSASFHTLAFEQGSVPWSGALSQVFSCRCLVQPWILFFSLRSQKSNFWRFAVASSVNIDPT